MQSDLGQIKLLPALPEAWSEGSVNGLCARGGFEISMAWQNKQLTSLHILSKAGGRTKLIYGKTIKEITLKKGESKNITL